MAIYEYHCITCKASFERRLPMSDVAVAVTCEKGHEAERLVSKFSMGRSDNELVDFDFPDGMGEEMAGGGGCCGGAGGCACGG